MNTNDDSLTSFMALVGLMFGMGIGWNLNESANKRPIEHLLHTRCVEINSTLVGYDSDTIFCKNGAEFPYSINKYYTDEGVSDD